MPRSLASSLADFQARFLAILPRIEKHGEIFFRNERCPGKKADCVAEMVALCWLWFVRLVQKGKDPTKFVSTLVSFAARAVKSGRRLCGQEKTKDVLSPLAQQRRGFVLVNLPVRSTLTSNPIAEALIDNTQTPPDEQAAFRIDFPAWLSTLDNRRRRIANDMLLSERTCDLARKHKVSPARISQLRSEFMEDWQRFCGDKNASESSITA